MPDSDTTILRTPRSIPERIWFWRIAIGKASGKSLAAGANSMIASLNGVNWTEFTTSQKTVAFLTMGVAMWQVMDAFLNSTMKELSDEEKKQIASETASVVTP